MLGKIISLIGAFFLGVILIWLGGGTEWIEVTLLGGTLVVLAPCLLLVVILMDRR